MCPFPDPGGKAEFVLHPHVRAPGAGPADGDLHPVRGVEIDPDIREPVGGAAVPGSEAQRIAFGPLLQQDVVAAEVRVHALRARDPPYLDAAGVVFPREIQGAEIVDDPGLFRRDALQHGPDLRYREVGISLAVDRQAEFPVRRDVGGFRLIRAGLCHGRSPSLGRERLAVIRKRQRISAHPVIDLRCRHRNGKDA